MPIVGSIKNKRSANIQPWRTVDNSIMQLAKHTVLRVFVRVDSDADVPSWETLPYLCEDDFCKHMLPGCAAKGLISWCSRQRCRLHDPERWHLQTHGTLQELFDTLPTWTCPVPMWEITMTTSFLDGLGDHLLKTQRVWKEISRLLASTLTARLGDVRIDCRIKGLGKLILASVTSTYLSHVLLRSY